LVFAAYRYWICAKIEEYICMVMESGRACLEDIKGTLRMGQGAFGMVGVGWFFATVVGWVENNRT